MRKKKLDVILEVDKSCADLSQKLNNVLDAMQGIQAKARDTHKINVVDLANLAGCATIMLKMYSFFNAYNNKHHVVSKMIAILDTLDKDYPDAMSLICNCAANPLVCKGEEVPFSTIIDNFKTDLGIFIK